MSRVDVVVPCYNYGRFLRECVDSALAQALVDVRVRIIDDASQDETPEVAAELARRDARVSYTRHDANRGHIATYNEGLLDWASGEFSLLLSADDYLLPGCLGRAAALMERRPDVGFTFGSAIELRPGDPKPQYSSDLGEDAQVLDGLEFVRRSGSGNLVPTATAVVRTDLQKRLGGYRADLPHAGDMEMWLRFAAHGSVGVFSQPQAVYRRHERNMSISYFADRKLALLDLRQRAAAFEASFDGPASRLADVPQMRTQMMGALAEDALWEAHAAFEAGRLDASREIASFAEGLHPPVRRTRPWATLALKHRLGPRASTALVSAADAVRYFARQRPGAAE